MNIQRPTGVELGAPERRADESKLEHKSPHAHNWRRYLALVLIAGAVGYFISTASITTLLIAGGIVAALFGLLVAWGLYIQNEVRGW